jgi:hypothetical protein
MDIFAATCIMRVAVILVIACAAVPLSASAEYFSKFGYSSDDVQRYKEMAATIGSCRTALLLDPHDTEKMNVRTAPHLATLYGQCGKALQARHASVQVLRVNDTFLGMQCIAVGVSGAVVPACNYPSHLPKP